MLLRPKVLTCMCWLAHLLVRPYNPCSRRRTSCRVASGKYYQACSLEACSARRGRRKYHRQRWRRRRGLGNHQHRPSYQGRRRPETTALQGSVRSRDPKGKTKPAARPLAKRAYAYVDRLRGASKYLDADDNARLVEKARSIDGFLLKQTKFHLEGRRCWIADGV